MKRDVYTLPANATVAEAMQVLDGPAHQRRPAGRRTGSRLWASYPTAISCATWVEVRR